MALGVVSRQLATTTACNRFGAALLLVTAPMLALAQDQHAAIHSTKGVQHKLPLISDDFIVGCIMIMFLLLFAFGACGRVASARAATVSDVACRAACCSQASSKFARSVACAVQREARCLRKLRGMRPEHCKKNVRAFAHQGRELPLYKRAHTHAMFRS